MTDDEYIHMRMNESPPPREEDLLLTFLAYLAVLVIVGGFIMLHYLGAPL